MCACAPVQRPARLRAGCARQKSEVLRAYVRAEPACVSLIVQVSHTLLNSFPLSQAGIKAVGVVAPGHSRESDTALLTGAPPLHPISPVSSSLVRCTLYFVCLPPFLKHPSPLAPSEAHCHCPHGRGGDYLNLEKIQQSGAISSTCRLWSKRPHITNSARLCRRSCRGVHRALRGNGRAPRPPLRRLPPLTLQGGGRLQ